MGKIPCPVKKFNYHPAKSRYLSCSLKLDILMADLVARVVQENFMFKLHITGMYPRHLKS